MQIHDSPSTGPTQASREKRFYVVTFGLLVKDRG